MTPGQWQWVCPRRVIMYYYLHQYFFDMLECGYGEGRDGMMVVEVHFRITPGGINMCYYLKVKRICRACVRVLWGVV